MIMTIDHQTVMIIIIDHHRHHHHNHLQNIDTVCIERAGELDGLKVSMWFRSVIGEMGDKLLRDEGHSEPERRQ